MEKVLNYIMEILAFLLAILILIFKDNNLLLLIIISVFAFLYGIIFVVKKKAYGGLLIGVSLSVFSSILLYKFNLLDLYNVITFCICLTLIISLLLTLVMDFFTRRRMLSIYSMDKEAEVVDIIKDTNGKKEMYKPIYCYKIDSKVFEVEYIKFLSKKKVNIGDKMRIRVNPNDYQDVYFDLELKERVFRICCYIYLSLIALFIIINLF